MHDGEIAFRPGYDRESIVHMGERQAWDESLLRCLHVCFLRRSSREREDEAVSGRPSPIELGGKRRSRLRRLARPFHGVSSGASGGSEWKQEKYRRGELVVKDASPFLGAPVGNAVLP
jgi:hypothetical protein